jgi:GT2 family glycosyltransferase
MVTLVIPVFNKVQLTERCLESVLKNSKALTSVIVVNNASQDGTTEALQKFKSRFEGRKISFFSIKNEKNLGFGAACNQGVRLAKTEYVAILNNDTWLMPDWDLALIDAQKENDFDVVGPFFDERPWSDDMEVRARDFLKKNRPAYRKHFVPILMFFTKDAIQRLSLPDGGIFDERFFVTYEDTDLVQRMKLEKMNFAQTSRCYIWHQSMGTRASGLLPEGYEAAGLRLFQEKWKFDPRVEEHTFLEKLKRKIRKARALRGRF